MKVKLKRFNSIIKFFIIVYIVFISFSNSSRDTNYLLLDNYNLDETVGVSAIALKEKQEKPKPVVTPVEHKNNYLYGDMTGYSADCPMCGGKLGCLPSYNVYKNGVVTYPDKTYGNVRIVASSKNIACGSIVKVDSSKYSKEPFYAIVLDRGVGGNNLDLLVASEQEAYNRVGRIKISYSVLRRGW